MSEKNNLIDMEVGFGINLGDTPSNVFSKDEANKAHPISLLIPVLTVVFSILQTKIIKQ